MKDLEKIFYGNIVAYDAALAPDAKHDDLAKVIWRYMLSMSFLNLLTVRVVTYRNMPNLVGVLLE